MMGTRLVHIDKKLVLWLVAAGFLPFLYHFFDAFVNGRGAEHNDISFGSNAIVHLLLNLLFSIAITVSISVVVITELNWLEQKFPWKLFSGRRFILELIISNGTSAGMMVLFGVVLLQINGLPEGVTINRYFFSGIATGIIMNLILTSFIESANLFKQWKQSLVQNERLQKETAQAQLQALRSQINPHFLFNSLNVLSSLVHSDADKAEEFIDEFARVYRYSLENQESDLVPVARELDMLESYVFLQKIRFGDGFDVKWPIGNKCNQYYVPAHALQLLVENAIKHNRVSDETPLFVTIECQEESVRVRNNLQKRNEHIYSTKIGLDNLRNRYKHYTAIEPQFCVTENEYIAEIPLLKNQ